MSYANENIENCYFFYNLHWPTFVKLFFPKWAIFQRKNSTCKGTVPCKKNRSTKPWMIIKMLFKLCPLYQIIQHRVITNALPNICYLPGFFFDRLISYEYSVVRMFFRLKARHTCDIILFIQDCNARFVCFKYLTISTEEIYT